VNIPEREKAKISTQHIMWLQKKKTIFFSAKIATAAAGGALKILCNFQICTGGGRGGWVKNCDHKRHSVTIGEPVAIIPQKDFQ
jgi:hypothetical protein